MAYNKRINTFKTDAEYNEYLNTSIAETPNIAFVVETNTVHRTNVVPNEHLVYGTTTKTSDFNLNAQNGPYVLNVKCHVVVEGDSGVNVFYSDYDDVPNASYKRIGTLDTTFLGNMSDILSLDKFEFDSSDLSNIESCVYCNTAIKTLNFSSFDTKKINRTEIDPFGNANNSALTKFIISRNYFNSDTATVYHFEGLGSWTNAASLAIFVNEIPEIEAGTKTVKLSSATKNALSQEQKDTITSKGWVIA